MTVSAEYIDEIVKSVLKELRSRDQYVANAAPAVSRSESTASGNVMSISGKVITESLLVAAGAAGKTISLPQGAVITPSGRDFIRKSGVRIASSVSGRHARSGLVILGVQSATIQSAASAAEWRVSTASSAMDAASLVLAEFSAGPVVYAGRDAAVVSCLLNRDSRIRAAVLSRPELMTELVSAMNPSVWCLEATTWSFGELLRTLKNVAPSAAMPGSWKELNAGGAR